MEKLVAVDIFK